MKCTLCGYKFTKNEAEVACKNCPIKKGCKLLRCPNCGFGISPAPPWWEFLMKQRKSDGNN